MPCGHEGKRIFAGVRTADPDGVMETGNAGRAKLRDILVAERLGIGLGREIDLERRQHVDHQRPLDDRDRARRVMGGRGGEQAIMAEIDHRRGERGGRDRSRKKVAAGRIEKFAQRLS